MNRIIIQVIIGLLILQPLSAQVHSDSLPPVAVDSVSASATAPVLLADSAGVHTRIDSLDTLPDSLKTGAAVNDSLQKAKETRMPVELRKDAPKRAYYGKDTFFYVFIALILIIGLLRQFFPKYFNDFSRIFFRRTLKQRQLYEQIIQTPVPSLLLNIFFFITAGIYVSYLLNYFGLQKIDNFWIQTFYASMGVAIIYLAKFSSLKLAGWLFNLSSQTDDYTFIVFMINKAIGIFLLPCLILIIFCKPGLSNSVLTLSWLGIGFMFLYRLYLSFQIARNRVSVNLFHFLLYILAFEIIPLLLIYKLLLMVF
ncbi:MAG: DUF4271 domain-containing protein [Terrimonas sp.]|nr:DUF4271 domain-containing protein [Terrimonas sp.]